MTDPRNTAIIAFDGSSAANHAVASAAKFLGACRVLVVTVWEEGLAYSVPYEISSGAPGEMTAPAIEPGVALEVDREVHDHAERVARQGAALAQSLGLDAQPLAIADEGTIPRTILKVADEQQAAAIVVGSRGVGGIRARLEGSTSKSLLKHASCPVIVVHEDREQHGG